MKFQRPMNCICRRLIWLGAAASLVASVLGEWKSIAADAATNQPPYARVYVLAVGVNGYPAGSGFRPLRFAESDARAVAHLFQTSFGFTTDLLVGANATRGVVWARFQDIQAKLRPEDDFIFYFSGHGATKARGEFGSDGFLVPAIRSLKGDSSAEAYREEAIPMAELVERVTGLNARHRLLVLDCCFSGYAAGATNCYYTIENNTPDMLSHPIVQVMTAGCKDELAVEVETVLGEPVNHGLFTYGLLEALKDLRFRHRSGIAVFTELRDTAITVAELQFQGRASTPQHRLLISSKGDMVFIPTSLQSYYRPAKAPPESLARYGRAVTTNELAEVRAKAELAGRDGGAAPVLSEDEVSRYEARASVGDPLAMNILTLVYGRGLAGKRNDQRARLWAEEAYDTRSPFGIIALAQSFQFGWGVQADPAKASRVAAESGLPKEFIATLNIASVVASAGGQNLSSGGMDTRVSVGGIGSLLKMLSLGNEANFQARFSAVQKAAQSKDWNRTGQEIGRLKTVVENMRVPANDASGKTAALKTDLLAEIKALQEAALDNDDTLVSQIILRMSQKTANSPTK